MKNKIELVVFDWAGTTIDYGSMAPVYTFKNIFENENISLSKDQINKPMGMEKRDHIKTLLEMPEINEAWNNEKGSEWTEEDVEKLYENFEENLATIVTEHSVPIDGVLETIETLRQMGIKIGSTTGYSSEMMENNVVEKAEEYGYKPDCLITPDKAGKGRPSPYMLYEAMKELNVMSARNVVKVGDTVADIKEGVNSGAWSVGVLKGSNLLGLTEEEYEKMSNEELENLKSQASKKYYKAGADFVIEDITKLPELINEINENFLNTDINLTDEKMYFYNPVKIIHGKGTINLLPELITSLQGIKNVLVLVWDESMFNLSPLIEIEEKNDLELLKLVFDKPNPNIDNLFNLYNKVKEQKLDLIIGIGGGSVLDLSKSLSIVLEKDIKTTDDIREMIENKEYSTPKIKWIGIPTTSGTGSEVTCWATIWDPEMNKKRSIDYDKNYAYLALVDPDLLHSQPIETGVSTAVDAVTQAVEAYWSKKTNIISRSYALSAISLITDNIDSLTQGNLQAYEPISQGSLMSGLAFSNTQTTACHAISYPLTMRYNIPHGVAVGLLLAPVMYYNEDKIINKQALFNALGVKSTRELSIKVKDLFEKANIPYRLRDWGVKEDELVEIAEATNTPGIFDNNPVDLSNEDVLNILKMIF